MHYDAIVLGVGGMGSAALYHLARRGLRVLGVEQFGIPHEMGSSHGLSRIIRLAYYEHPSYVPLLRRAYDLWRELEAATSLPLLTITGSIDAAPPGGQVFEGSRASCELHDLPHDVLDAAQLHARFPGYRLPDGHMALFQPQGGILAPERCIVAHVQAARSHGAEVWQNTRVLGWEATADGVRLTTADTTVSAGRLVITAGAWAAQQVPGLGALARPERQALIWMRPHAPALFQPGTFPVFNLEVAEGRFYGFPEYDQPGFKYGRWNHRHETVDPDTVDRAANADDEAVLRPLAERYFPQAAGPTLMMKVCMFTMTPDEHFVVDHVPGTPQVVYGAGFSGHGYKMCSVIGEALAGMAADGGTPHDLALFRRQRFAPAVSSM